MNNLPVTISTHILDLATGRPAADVRVVLERKDEDQWVAAGTQRRSADGRVSSFADNLTTGVYRLTFGTVEYFRRTGLDEFFLDQTVAFTANEGRKYHVPLLLSPFGYSTYRGS